MNRAILSVIAIAAVAAASALGYWAGKSQPAGSSAPAPAKAQAGGQSGTPVEAMAVKQISLPQTITAVGSLRSDEAVVLRPEVAGRISEILFREGQRVQQGDVLVRFDSSVQRAELDQAKANLSLNQSKFERAVDLQKKGFISSQARDEAENNYRVSKASVDLFAARLAKLELRAPFTGLAGLRQVSVGDYVKDGQDLVNIETIDPLKVDFRVPEIYLRQVAVGQSMQIGLDAFPNQNFSGQVLAINPLVDANGRSIVIRAQVRNSGSQLRPGMFARVRLLVGGVQESLAVPEQALVPVGDDLYVFKVVDGKAQRTKIDIGQRRDALVEIVKGLSKSDVVVTAGLQKIRDGANVKVTLLPDSATKQSPDPAASNPAAGNTTSAVPAGKS
ncbi:MAG: efflux RND transporter periplasmic adaptor subunit [Burkholderiales bacterium]|nr:efflux RND transporter periplasmic adaptor subunit [Burkholderiales bacterium]